MKVIGDFTENSRCELLPINDRSYRATWESDPGFVEVPGLTEYKVRVDDDAGDAVVFMRWLVADINVAGGKEGMLAALESHSPDGADWAACLAKNCQDCPPSLIEGGAVALLALIASTPAYQGHGLGTPLAKAFAQAVLVPRGIRAFWIKPIPLTEHAPTGFFKPLYAPGTAAFHDAKDRLERHYQGSLDAEWTCPDYLRADLPPPEKS